MKLSELAAKPKLIKITMDDQDLVKEFGEPLEFWTWDRQPMETFLAMSNMDGENYASIIDSVRKLVLDESAKPIINGDVTLPTKVMLRVITKVVETLGK